ncbi:hypothetical protein AKJ09_08265 [Labilithrix luteola]|uniref:Uncharacterized protein n=1 Tax=Labilithrix luteola TaxID=1391654 RepID=A0A0K1Q7F7_9BACT|nr:hypothetical protein AKJ09_08265 [Labilithrix luteola]
MAKAVLEEPAATFGPPAPVPELPFPHALHALTITAATRIAAASQHRA